MLGAAVGGRRAARRRCRDDARAAPERMGGTIRVRQVEGERAADSPDAWMPKGRIPGAIFPSASSRRSPGGRTAPCCRRRSCSKRPVPADDERGEAASRCRALCPVPVVGLHPGCTPHVAFPPLSQGTRRAKGTSLQPDRGVTGEDGEDDFLQTWRTCADRVTRSYEVRLGNGFSCTKKAERRRQGGRDLGAEGARELTR